MKCPRLCPNYFIVDSVSLCLFICLFVVFCFCRVKWGWDYLKKKLLKSFSLLFRKIKPRNGHLLMLHDEQWAGDGDVALLIQVCSRRRRGRRETDETEVCVCVFQLFTSQYNRHHVILNSKLLSMVTVLWDQILQDSSWWDLILKSDLKAHEETNEFQKVGLFLCCLSAMDP